MKEILQNIFQADYCGYQVFTEQVLKPVFGQMKDTSVQLIDELLTDNDKTIIQHVTYIGIIPLELGDELYCFDVTLMNNVHISHNRVLIQQFIRKTLPSFATAIIIFHYPENKGDWRVSFVSKEDGTHETTSAKRYTYLLGKKHRCRTAAERFSFLAKNDKSVTNILGAFSVEVLSDDFFNKYKDIYADLVEFITGKRMVKVKGKWEEQVKHEPHPQMTEQFGEEEGSEKDVRDYIKKMMGRLVFLQFLQKKGWMGVPANRDDWNGGNLNYLQDLYANTKFKEDFLESVLEPLFFNTLNNGNRENDIADSVLGCNIKIPYLNGGLFEEDDLDKKKVTFPSSIFKDILDFFGQYNFTIDENDPNDQEVGVDPEMLGRIFENLLEDNKDKGAFYTPKEVVQYMCRESLITYLQTDSDIYEEKIRRLVTTYTADNFSKEEKIEIERKLIEVKVCDPAVGSGAFPMGMLNEIYQCYIAISGQLDSASNIKRQIIQNSIYGVDLEKGAVDIARLRFWLALIVDEETPEPLPNLDYKIMQGNSLLESFEGIDLSEIIGEDKAKRKKNADSQMNLAFDERFTQENLNKSIKQFFGTTNHEQKDLLRMQINTQVKEHIIACCPGRSDIIEKVEKMDMQNKPFFLWHTYFADVFDEKKRANKLSGFDIVIGNPPYVDIKNLPYDDVKYYFKAFETTQNRINLYAIFIERSMQLLNKKGVLTYINPNSILVNDSYSKLRRMLVNNISIIIKLPDSIFKNAIVETVINQFIKENITKNIRGVIYNHNDTFDGGNIQFKLYDRKIWEQDIKTRFNIFINFNIANLLWKIEQDSTPLIKIADFSLGITPYDKYKGHSTSDIENKIYHSKEKITELYKPLISGTNIVRYVIKPEIKEYIKYGKWLGAPREERFFTQPRIIVRQIISGNPLRIYAGYTNDEYYFTQIGFGIIPKDNRLTKYLLALLNSTLFTFYHTYKYLDTEKVTFQKILIANCKEFPIKIMGNIQPIIDIVDEIILIKSTNPEADISTQETMIDYLVYRIYCLNNKDIKIIQDSQK